MASSRHFWLVCGCDELDPMGYSVGMPLELNSCLWPHHKPMPCVCFGGWASQTPCPVSKILLAVLTPSCRSTFWIFFFYCQYPALPEWKEVVVVEVDLVPWEWCPAVFVTLIFALESKRIPVGVCFYMLAGQGTDLRGGTSWGCSLQPLQQIQLFHFLAVIRRGLDESESILFGEMGVPMTVELWPIIADALILYAVAGSFCSWLV